MSESSQRYYEQNREEILAKKQAYWQANRETLLVKKRAYQSANRETINARQREYLAANSEKKRERDRAYHAANREKRVAYGRYYYASKTRERQLVSLYGISEQEYQSMLERQGGVCAICRKPETATHAKSGVVKRLNVDHCHETGQIRGLLCQSCNRAIGLLNHDKDLFHQAIAYLSRSFPDEQGRR
jgi:hypothetical protein